jgi:hypothetical protein
MQIAMNLDYLSARQGAHLLGETAELGRILNALRSSIKVVA